MKAGELVALLDIVLRHVAEVHGIEDVAFDEFDYYWTVPSDDWLSMEKSPEVVVGSLSDDEAELRKLLSEPDRASALDLERLANVLRFLSDQVLRK